MRRIVVPILLVCTFVTVLGMTFLEDYFYRTRPRMPDPTVARVYPQDVKGFEGVARVYLTRSEKLPFEWMPYWSPILVGADSSQLAFWCIKSVSTLIMSDMATLSRLTKRCSRRLPAVRSHFL
jgi:hypothetical protein